LPVNYDDELRLAYLRAAVTAQAEEEDKVAAYRDFYEGEQGVKLSERQEEYLTGRGDGLDTESFGNVCKRVVNVPNDRLMLRANGIAPADPDADAYSATVTDWWNALQLESKQKEVYEASLRDGNVAVIVGWDGEKPVFTPNLVYDGATGLVRFHYDNDNNLLYASKRWKLWDPKTLGVTGKTRLTLYLDDRIERFEYDNRQASGWRPLEAVEVIEESKGQITQNPQPWLDRQGEPMGIPVIPFENPGGSELADVVALQKLVNHSLGSFDEAVDQHAWPILWASGIDLPRDSDGDAYVPGYGPGQMFTLSTDGEMGRIDPADLERLFRAGVLSWLHVLAVVKGWPLFVLDRSSQPPSGIALRIMESGLVAQVESKQAVFGGAWLKCFELGRKLHRFYTGVDLVGELALNWEPAETQDEKTDMETRQIKWDAGKIPTVQRWRELGYTEVQINDMKASSEFQATVGLAQMGLANNG
jgi:hypothetical protein